jgi:sugar phosphate isomerase/epimerase
VFRLGYNTNGLPHHRPLDALEVLAELGYEGVALTPDVGGLDLYDLAPTVIADLRSRSEDLGLDLAVETGARFLLDPRRKHWPTLLEADPMARERRIDFLRRSIDLAVALGAGLFSIWSGAAPGNLLAEPAAHGEASQAAERERVWERLCTGLSRVLEHARLRDVRITFEPEPGMFIERPAGFAELLARLGDAGDELGLTLDVGHLVVTGDLPVGAIIRSWSQRLAHVHLDDARPKIHEHLMFGSGELDLAATLRALIETGFSGQAAVELSRDGHRGPSAALEAMDHLRRALMKIDVP